jgi:protein tyrosine/serine phosphatase
MTPASECRTAAKIAPVKPPAQSRWRSRILVAGCLALLSIPLFLVTWNNGLRQFLFPKKWGVVEPGRIYRSGQISPRLIERTLERNHIGLIIDLSSDDNEDARAEREVTTRLKIPRLDLFLHGNGVGDPNVYVKALSAIIEADRHHTPVLVHCQAGTERTGGVIATYRILVEGESQEKAFTEARSYGHSDGENPHLVPFVREHLDEWRAELLRRQLVGG